MKPELLLYLKGYNKRSLSRDVVAGGHSLGGLP